MASETVPTGLQQEIAVQRSRLFNAVCALAVLAGAGLYIEGALNNGPADSLAGATIAGIGTVFLYRHRGQNPSQPHNS